MQYPLWTVTFSTFRMTLVVTQLRLNKAKEKRQTMYASNSLVGKLIIVPTKNSCHL